MSVPQFVPPWTWLQYVMGLHWPKGDEDGLRACGAAWREAGDGLLTAGGHGDDVASKVNSAVASMSADAFTAYWDKVVQPDGVLDELALQCLSVSGYADSAALELEATKISMNVVAVLMYIEFLEALAEVAATFGLGTPAVAVQLAAEEFATREALVMLAQSLLKALEFTLLPDVIAQGWQVLDGSRPISQVDWSQLGHDLEHGLVLGPLFAIPGVGGGLARKFDLAGRFPLLGKFSLPGNVFARTGGNLAFAGASNVAANAVTWSVDQGIQNGLGVKGWAGRGGPFAGWQQAFANGVFMNGFHTAAGGIRARYGDPKLGITTTDGQNLLLRDRTGNTVTADNPSGLFVFSQPDLTRQPDYLGRGTVDPRSGVVTVTDRNGGSTGYQAQQIHTLDRGRTTSTVGYAPVDPGSTVSGGSTASSSAPRYEPVAQTVHGGGDTGLPSNVSVQADANGQNQTVAYRGVGMPGTDPALDRNGTFVAPGSVHVFDSNAPETPRVVVAGGAGVVPAGFGRVVGPHEAVVYGHDGTVHSVYSYPGSTVHGATPDQLPHAGQQAVYNPDGSFRGLEIQNEAMRPQQIADPTVLAAAHQRAAAGIGLHAPTPEPAARGELPFNTAEQSPSPSVLTTAEHNARVDAASQSPVTPSTDGVRRFSEQLNGTSLADRAGDAVPTADATARQDALVGAAAEQTTVATIAAGQTRAALLAGGSGGPHESGGGGHGGAELPPGSGAGHTPGHDPGPGGVPHDDLNAARLEHALPPTHQVHPGLADAFRPADHLDIPSQVHWARQVYDTVRQNPHDVTAIVEHLARVPRADGRAGYTHDEIQAIREHVFTATHQVPDGNGHTVEAHFDEDPALAAAWQRLSTGRAEPHDLTLLDHELAEMRLHEENPGWTHQQAHEAANREANWETTLVPDTRRALYDAYPRDDTGRAGHGDPGVLRDGGRGSPHDPLSLGQRTGRDGSGTGAGEGDRAPAARPGPADHPADGRRPQDLHAEGTHGDLAAAGSHGGLAPAGERPFTSGGASGSGHGSGPDDVPFGFEHLVRTEPEVWMDTAVEFEQAIGAADFKDPAVLATLRDALVRARHALRELNDPLPGESRADFEYRIDTLFFDSKAENAGNIGVDVPFDRLVDSGDVRESLTALYNAFYLHADRPEVFKNSLMRAADGGDWARVDRSGADTAEIRERYRLLNSPMRRVGRGLENNPAVKRAARLGTDDRHLFDKDFFSSYSVIRAADHPVSDFVRSTVSYVNVRYRKDAEQLDYAHSAQDYADLGAPLGELSREFQEPRVSGPLDDPTVKLTWREGLTLHDKSNSWTQAANERGVPTVDGVSLTTTKMLNAAQLLGLDHGQRELFLKGLMAWMLPGRDHSLYEIALGARIAGVGPIAEGRVGGMGPVDLYRRTLDWHGETGSVPKVPEPHQIHYQNLVRDARWITETRHNDPELVEVLDLVDKQRAQLESGIVTDGVPDPATGRIPVHTLHSWLERNGVDPLDPVAVRAAGETLSEAHLTAVAVYTIHIHPYMLNAMILDSFAGRLPFGVGDKAVGAQFRMALNGYVKGYLADLADGKFPRRMPIALRPIFHTGAEGEPLNSHSPVTPVVAQWLDADRRAETGNMPDGPKSLARLSADLATEQRDLAYSRISERVAEHLPQLLNEVLIHSDMLQDALLHFPTVGSPEHPVLVYRGDRGGVMGFVRYGHPTLAPRATTRETLSTSLDPQVAIDFIGFNPREGSAPTLVVYELTGKYARDISAFTVYPTAAEVLFPLGATMSRVTDAARIAEIRASLPDNLPPGCEIIVLEEV